MPLRICNLLTTWAKGPRTPALGLKFRHPFRKKGSFLWNLQPRPALFLWI